MTWYLGMAAFFTFLNRCPIGNRSGRNRLVSPANATVERESLEKERGPFVSRRRQSRIRWNDCALEQADKRVGGYIVSRWNEMSIDAQVNCKQDNA